MLAIRHYHGYSSLAEGGGLVCYHYWSSLHHCTSSSTQCDLAATVSGSIVAFIALLSMLCRALYAHRIKPWWQDLDQPEQWGFLSECPSLAFPPCGRPDGRVENQIRPFKIRTPDGEELYAWHILPIALYAKSEADLVLDPTGSDIDVTKTTAFRLLKEDPESRLVVSCQCFSLLLLCVSPCWKLIICSSRKRWNGRAGMAN